MKRSSVTVLSQGWDGPFYRVRTLSFEVAFLIGADEELDQVNNVDVEVRLPDGSRWSATVFTVAEVERLMARWAETGEHSGGKYFWCSDGLVVRDPGVDNFVRVLAAIHEEGQLTTILNRLDEAAGSSAGV
ncbi:hypothetical protein SD37_24665 [Amycolatopsis orientalis]|uniref:Uncharacterized protein n=1 Tax=Amycolatopsis orientalis TaxID=31958 RepID=A0A193C272_AMYOR|nr:hypothetical protein [Amycolatopsis orientalis]ANN18503.1 hypothetical protein SD37_24665 [Amycolatopsis orientalis]